MHMVMQTHSIRQTHSFSKGQAAAWYICDQFLDTVSSSYHSYIRDLFNELDKCQEVPLLVIDIGSSGTNIKLHLVSFDEKGNVSCSESIVVPNLPLGAQGGSNHLNQIIKKFLGRKLSALEKKGYVELRPGDLAAYVSEFDGRKPALDFLDGGLINLYGRQTNQTFSPSLTESERREVFYGAFGKSLDTVERAIRRVIEMGKDFAVLFCGGSSANRCLQRILRERMEQYKSAQQFGMTMNSGFLSEKDTVTWSSAVMAGAGLAVLRKLNYPTTKVLDTSAIGLHLIGRLRRKGWVGEDVAEFLFSKGCRSLVASEHQLPAAPKARNNIRFSLVCDPKYDLAAALRVFARDGSFPSLPTVAEAEILTGPSYTYDLGWCISAVELPKGKVQFRMSGRRVRTWAAGTAGSTDVAETQIQFILSCYGVVDGQRPLRHDLDKKWLLTLETHPGTLLLRVAKSEVIPFWCHRCREEIAKEAWVCRQCEDKYAICHSCSPIGYERGHIFKSMDLRV